MIKKLTDDIERERERSPRTGIVRKDSIQLKNIYMAFTNSERRRKDKHF